MIGLSFITQSWLQVVVNVVVVVSAGGNLFLRVLKRPDRFPEAVPMRAVVFWLDRGLGRARTRAAHGALKQMMPPGWSRKPVQIQALQVRRVLGLGSVGCGAYGFEVSGAIDVLFIIAVFHLYVDVVVVRDAESC